MVKPFLANLHYTISKKYSYMYSMTPKFFYFFFNIWVSKKRRILRWFQIRGNNLKKVYLEKVICQKLVRTTPLALVYELRQARKARPGTLVDQCLLSWGDRDSKYTAQSNPPPPTYAHKTFLQLLKKIGALNCDIKKTHERIGATYVHMSKSKSVVLFLGYKKCETLEQQK